MFRQRGPADPLLGSSDWRKKIRGHWLRLAPPCARCGGAIDYAGPYFVATPGGKRTINRRALHVGHIVSRAEARRRGWSAAQINAISNTQAEHAGCSVKSGARLGRMIQTQRRAVTSRVW